ncbi:hypothetical protein GWK47_037823 [Chionoecetes opilio]|uniref:Uncharacterized protein n=1 Tax=Chionoecetes opilio TaxID=41210 RepID=A0A8J4YEJ8_CHIOP|nr:hypothetical protein GWK47_037823 [Chionoecetes opilio]
MAAQLAPPLTIIFNNILSSCKWPTQWKEARVVAIHKKKKQTRPKELPPNFPSHYCWENPGVPHHRQDQPPFWETPPTSPKTPSGFFFQAGKGSCRPAPPFQSVPWTHWADRKKVTGPSPGPRGTTCVPFPPYGRQRNQLSPKDLPTTPPTSFKRGVITPPPFGNYPRPPPIIPPAPLALTGFGRCLQQLWRSVVFPRSRGQAWLAHQTCWLADMQSASVDEVKEDLEMSDSDSAADWVQRPVKRRRGKMVVPDREQRSREEQEAPTMEVEQHQRQGQEAPALEEELNQRKRLYFPTGDLMTLSQKRVWAARLAVKHREFRPLLKEGVNRPFVTVEGQAAVDNLTSVGFQDTVLVDLW